MGYFDNFFSKDNLKAEVDLLMKADADDLPLKPEIDQDEGLKLGRKANILGEISNTEFADALDFMRFNGYRR